MLGMCIFFIDIGDDRSYIFEDSDASKKNPTASASMIDLN